VRVVSAASEPLLERKVLADLAAGERVPPHDDARAGRAPGEVHAAAVARLVQETGRRPEVVCVDGQTVLDRPPPSWQLISVWPVVTAAGRGGAAGGCHGRGGVPAPWRAGARFAVPGLLLGDGVEITPPGVTGGAGPIGLSGAWMYPPQTVPAGAPTHRPAGPDRPTRPARPTAGTC
jgi:hypothetical protein